MGARLGCGRRDQQPRLGHSQISTTMRYAAASVEVIRIGNERLSKLLEVS